MDASSQQVQADWAAPMAAAARPIPAITMAAPAAALNAAWEEMPEVEQFDVAPGEGEFFRCALTPRDGRDLRPAIFALALRNHWPLRELTRSRHSLEDIYLQVTRPDQEELE